MMFIFQLLHRLIAVACNSLGRITLIYKCTERGKENKMNLYFSFQTHFHLKLQQRPLYLIFVIIDTQNGLGQKGLSKAIQSKPPVMSRDTFNQIRLVIPHCMQSSPLQMIDSLTWELAFVAQSKQTFHFCKRHKRSNMRCVHAFWI